jgi:hypothetical protein
LSKKNSVGLKSCNLFESPCWQNRNRAFLHGLGEFRDMEIPAQVVKNNPAQATDHRKHFDLHGTISDLY